MRWALGILVTTVFVGQSGVVADSWLAWGRDPIGGLPCNASDWKNFVCQKAANAPPLTDCGTEKIIDTSLNQRWRDERGTTTTICTDSQCVNEIKWLRTTSDDGGCTPFNEGD